VKTDTGGHPLFHARGKSQQKKKGQKKDWGEKGRKKKNWGHYQ